MSNEVTLQQIWEKLNELSTLTLIAAKPVLNLDEMLLYTGMCRSRAYKLTSTHGIPHFKLGQRVYFKRSELDEWMTKRRVATREEIEERAEAYTILHPLR